MSAREYHAFDSTATFDVFNGIAWLLGNDAVLSDHLGLVGVYDHIPKNERFPYIRLGETRESPKNTHKTFGRLNEIRLHIWSQYDGFKEICAIADRCMFLFETNDLTNMANWQHVQYIFTQFLTLREPDGQTRHGVIEASFHTTKL